jgi:hypothetical protein
MKGVSQDLGCQANIDGLGCGRKHALLVLVLLAGLVAAVASYLSCKGASALPAEAQF